jgi:hypothetical protein
MKDFYYILGLEINCTFDDIKDAYRKLSKKYHPDLNQGDPYFESRFREIKEAYDTLSDPPKRALYDKELKEFRAGNIEAERRGQPYQPQYASRRRRRGPGVGMTIVFILITLIIGDYLIRSFSKPKAVKPPQAIVEVPVAAKPHKLHKKKHLVKDKTKGDSFKHAFERISNMPAHPKPLLKPTKPKPTLYAVQPKPVVSPALPKPNHVMVQSSPESNRSAGDNRNYLFAAYVRPNATGIVNMRKFDEFDSEVIKKIPANAKVLVLAKGDTYYRVAFNNDIGYVPKWALQAK